MRAEKFLDQYENCWQGEKPACTMDCPFRLDVPDFVEKMGRNNYNAAYRTFRNEVAFPEIVAALCPEYCGKGCVRCKIDEPIRVNQLEKICVAKATKKDANDFNIPPKTKKIAIVGAGLAGLGCLQRLTSWKYDVTLYEKSGKIGGKVLDMVPEALFQEEIERQFKYETYSLKLNTEITDSARLKAEGFDAAFFSFEEGECTVEDGFPVFRTKVKAGEAPILALAEGLRMATAIEVYLKVQKMEYPKMEGSAKFEPVTWGVPNTPSPAVFSDGKTAPADYSDEDIKAEANRCLHCHCNACEVYCDLIGFYKKVPKKLRDEVIATVSPSDSLIHGTPARKRINACTQCGLCQDVCPSHIEVKEYIRAARKELHRMGKMPFAYHQFWLRDMDFANGPYSALLRQAPGEVASPDGNHYAFFPGCQMGASDPEMVAESYQWLLKKRPDTALMLRCCGVPSEWSGDDPLHVEEVQKFDDEWKHMGEPILILACPSCRRELAESHPQIPTVSLYQVMDQWKKPGEFAGKALNVPEQLSLFDPCPTRNHEDWQNAVRNLLDDGAVKWQELPEKDRHGCCGFGGQLQTANPKMAAYVAKKRSALSEDPYVTYCSNCRDVFLDAGKPAYHVLEMLLGIPPVEETPDVTRRRENRVKLKETLLKEVWNETMGEKPEMKYKLKISPEKLEKMDKDRILEEDVCYCLELAEQLKRRVFNKETGTYSAFRQMGYLTLWVEYKPMAPGSGYDFEIINTYSHRIQIELEMMWNGNKTDFDLR